MRCVRSHCAFMTGSGCSSPSLPLHSPHAAPPPVQFARRMSLQQVEKLLDEAVFEEVEVAQVVDRRVVAAGAAGGAAGGVAGTVTEYLVRWSDGSEDSWEPAENVGEDLIRDFEEGMEYGEVEAVLGKRRSAEASEGGPGGVEYLVKWADAEEPSWEPEENLDEEVVAEYEASRSGEASKGAQVSA